MSNGLRPLRLFTSSKRPAMLTEASLALTLLTDDEMMLMTDGEVDERKAFIEAHLNRDGLTAANKILGTHFELMGAGR